MKKLTILTIITSLILTACIHEEKQQNFATITGKVYSGAKEIKFDYFDKNSADVMPEKYVAKADSMGKFSIKIPLQKISQGCIKVEQKRYDAIFMPGDNINILIYKDSISYSGKGAEKNNFINMLSYKDKCSRHKIINSWYTEEHEISEFYTMIEDYMSARKKEFDKFKASHELQKEYEEYFDIDNKLSYIDLCKYATIMYSRKKKAKIDSIQIPDKYKINPSIKQLVNDKYLVCNQYIEVLRDLISSQTQDMVNEDSTLDIKQVRLSMIMDSLSGKTREHYLLKKIYYKLSLYDHYDSTYISAFDSIKQDANCIAKMKEEITKFQRKQAMINAPLDKDFLSTTMYDTANVKMTMADVLKKSHGKVVYIDIWSLNCGPCRIAMPLSKKLKEKLKDYSIDFIYLTVDDYSDKLWNEIFEVSLTKKNHYRFAKGFGSKIHKMFNIIGVPTYLLIDKKGNLVSYKAERPYNRKWKENPKLEETLIDLATK